MAHKNRITAHQQFENNMVEKPVPEGLCHAIRLSSTKNLILDQILKRNSTQSNYAKPQQQIMTSRTEDSSRGVRTAQHGIRQRTTQEILV
jgi:hypothetical protein